MKKTSFIIRAAAAALTAVFVFAAASACSVKPGDKAETRAEGREEVNALAAEFMAESLKQTNYVMTITSNGETVSTYTRDGDTAMSVDAGGDSYAFIRDGKYCAAYTDEEIRGIYESKEYYYDPIINSLEFWLNTCLISEIEDENADWSFSAVRTDKTEKGEKHTVFSLDSENAEGKRVVNATARDGLIDRLELTDSLGEDSNTFVIEIAYGAASVTLPDFSGYEYNIFDDEGVDE